MRKSQIISMDFIMTFVVYIFALSVFFFSLGRVFTYTESATFDVPAELLFARIDQTPIKEFDFLDGSRIIIDNFEKAVDKNNEKKFYDFIFKDFENPNYFRKIDYCIFIENKTALMPIIRNFRTWDKDNYPNDYAAILDEATGTYCGKNFNLPYNATPYCNESIKTEALLLTRPVLFGRDIMNLKVLICAEKK